MGKHVIMTGFMGAGKTTVGKALAEKQKVPFLDTDQLIEEKAGMTISRIFETQGEEALRKMETSVLEERLKGDHTRPMLQGGDAGERVRSLLEYRTPLYQKAADLVVDVDDKTVSRIVVKIIELL